MRNKVFVRNLVISLFLWMATVMCYNCIMTYENYFPGDTYDNDITVAAFELTAYMITGVLFSRVGAKRFFFMAYMLAIIGGLGVMIIDEIPELELMFSYLARFGISATYQAVYLNNDLFPIIFASTTFGVCNIFAGISNAISIEVTLLEEDPMMFIYLGFAIAAAILSLFIIKIDPNHHR